MQCRVLELWVLMFVRDCFVGLLGDVLVRVSVDVINTIVKNNLKGLIWLTCPIKGSHGRNHLKSRNEAEAMKKPCSLVCSPCLTVLLSLFSYTTQDQLSALG